MLVNVALRRVLLALQAAREGADGEGGEEVEEEEVLRAATAALMELCEQLQLFAACREVSFCASTCTLGVLHVYTCTCIDYVHVYTCTWTCPMHVSIGEFLWLLI